MAGKANNVTSKVSAVEHSIFAEYKTKTPQSSELYERARKSLAGGVTGNLRYFEPYPLYESGGQGSKVYDADGNQCVTIVFVVLLQPFLRAIIHEPSP